MTEDGTAAFRTGRETTQRDRKELLYWATELTAGYLGRRVEPGAGSAEAAPPAGPGVLASGFRGARSRTGAARAAVRLRRCLWPTEPTHPPGPCRGRPKERPDPLRLSAAGEEVLRRRLRALSQGELTALIEAHGLSRAETRELSRLPPEQLVSLIVRAVQERRT